MGLHHLVLTWSSPLAKFPSHSWTFSMGDIRNPIAPFGHASKAAALSAMGYRGGYSPPWLNSPVMAGLFRCIDVGRCAIPFYMGGGRPPLSPPLREHYVAIHPIWLNSPAMAGLFRCGAYWVKLRRSDYLSAQPPPKSAHAVAITGYSPRLANFSNQWLEFLDAWALGVAPCR